jgi:hypothetical protein
LRETCLVHLCNLSREGVAFGELECLEHGGCTPLIGEMCRTS